MATKVRAKARGRGALLRAPIGVALLIGTMIGGYLVWPLVASATSNPTYDITSPAVFELDGNTARQAATAPPSDWESLLDSTGTQLASAPANLVAAKEFVENSPDFAFTGGGSKDTLDTTSWQCAVHPVDNKDELTFAGGALFVAPSGSTASDGTSTAGHELFYVNLNRGVSTNGSSNAGFWLFKQKTECNQATGTFTHAHSNGDLFIFASYTIGGTQVTVNTYHWSTASNSLVGPDATFTACDAATKTPGGCGISNSGVAAADGTGTLQGAFVSEWGNALTNGFFEAGIDLTRLYSPGGVGVVPCFSSFEADTRSTGSSVDGTLKDYAGGSFNTCGSTTMNSTPATANPTTIHSGSSTTLTFYEKNDGLTKLFNPSVVTSDSACNATIAQVTSGGFNTGDANQNGSFDAGETWVFGCTTTDLTALGAHVITATGNGYDALGNDVTFCSAGNNNYPCNSNEQTTVTVTVINPGTALTESASALVTYTFNETNTGTNAPLTIPSLGVTSNDCDTTPTLVNSGGSGTLSSGLTSGTTYTTLSLSSLSAPIANGDSVQIGTGATKQVVTAAATAATSTGPTTLSVLSFTANAAYGIGTAAADLPVLNSGVTWTYTCTHTLIGPPATSAPGLSTSETNIGTGGGTDVTGTNITYPGYPKEQNSVTVAITNNGQCQVAGGATTGCP